MEGVVIVNGYWNHDGTRCCVVNVHTLCLLVEIIDLWDKIQSIIEQETSSCICILGTLIQLDTNQKGKVGVWGLAEEMWYPLILSSVIPNLWTYHYMVGLSRGAAQMVLVKARSAEFLSIMYGLISGQARIMKVSDARSRIIVRSFWRIEDTQNIFAPIIVSNAHQHALLLVKQLTGGTSQPSAQNLLPNSSSPTTSSSTGWPTIAPPIPLQACSQQGPCCFTCGEPGHRANDCPKSTNTNDLLLDDMNDGGYHGPPMFDVDPCEDLPEEHLHSDVGQALVLRRVFLAPQDYATPIHHTNIFTSMCTINDKRYINHPLSGCTTHPNAHGSDS
ncbi:hypothetical protein ACS0TY_013765 [Phlomoides rotata]